MSAFQTGEKVTHSNFSGNVDVVFGHVTAHDEGERKTQVKWADGSGPTWHRTSALMLLDPSPGRSSEAPSSRPPG